MGLIDKIFKKVAVPNNIIFDNFVENYELNVNKVKLMTKPLLKDMQRIRKCNFAVDYMEDLLNEKLELKSKLIEITGSDNLSGPLTFVVDSSIWYSLYFMNTDEGKKAKERQKVANRLKDLYDLTIFAILKYFNFERKEPLEFRKMENKFYHQSNTNGMGSLRVVGEILNNIADLFKAIYDADNTRVYNVYQNLRELNVVKQETSPFEEF